MSQIAGFLIFRSKLIVALSLIIHCNEAIKLVEERAGENQRYISMTELEEKSEYYLKHRKGIGDEEEIKEKVKIMCDRFEELYREHGLDALHDIFAEEHNLHFALGKEDVWQRFIENLVYPKPPPEWAYAKHFFVSIAAIFIIAVVVATPFSYRYAKRFIKGSHYNNVDAEWKGAETKNPVLVRRIKKRSRRILYKPMLPKFDLKTESPSTDEAKLMEAIDNLKQQSVKEEQRAAKKRKEWEDIITKHKLDEIRRKKILECDDDYVEDLDEWDNKTGKRKQLLRGKKKIVDLKLKTFFNGQYRMNSRKKQ